MKNSKLFALFLISFTFFIFWSQALPVTDSVESNYALTAKEMAGSGDWISPRIYGKFWYDKPVMIYWLLALAIKLIGGSDLALRIVPAIFGAAGVCLIYWFLAKLNKERLGWIAAILLGTSFQYFIISKLLITDMILFDLNAAALALFYFGYSEQNGSKGWYLPMYICLGFAVLTKGPVGILLPGLVIFLFLVWQKQLAELKRMRLFAGTLLFLGVAMPWYTVMYLKHGEAFIRTFFGIHNYLRATVSEHPRDNVVYYYFLLFGLSTLPWTGVMLGGIWDGYKKIRRFHHDLSLFLIIWVGVFFVFYSLMATKYPTYTFPILFPVVVLAALYVGESLEKEAGLSNSIIILPLLVWEFLFLFIGYRFLKNIQFQIYSLIIILIFIGTLWRLLRSKARNRWTFSFYGVVVVYLLLSVMVLPVLAQSRSGKNFARIIDPYVGADIGTYRFYSTSAVYYSGNVISRIEPRDTIGGYRNNPFSWSAKYTMPIVTIQEFSARPGKDKIAIVPKTLERSFLGEAAGVPLTKIAEKEDYIIYCVKP